MTVARLQRLSSDHAQWIAANGNGLQLTSVLRDSDYELSLQSGNGIARIARLGETPMVCGSDMIFRATETCPMDIIEDATGTFDVHAASDR